MREEGQRKEKSNFLEERVTDEGFSKLYISAAINSVTKSKLMNYFFFFWAAEI